MRGKGFFSSYTGILIFVNVVLFVAFLIMMNSMGDAAIPLVAIQPAMIMAGQNVWTFITSMFMHASMTHLFVNMVSLFFLGTFVERLIGKKRFLWLYVVGGLVASLFFVVLAGFFGGSSLGGMVFGSPLAFAVGASGAIFALGGLLAVLTPKLPVLVFFVIPMPMWMAMIGLIVVVWLASLALPFGVGNTAHLGGLLVGIAYGFYLKKKFPRKTQMISRYFSK